jgi:hypothetical protein
MADPADLRVSDQDREDVVREIREHFAAGRLSGEELGPRVQAVYEARTESQLRELRADLPPLPVTREQQRAELAARRSELQRRVLQQSAGSLAPFVICTVIWFATGAHGHFWPIWVALFAVIALVRNGWALYGPAPELDRVERELEERHGHGHGHRGGHGHRHGHRGR